MLNKVKTKCVVLSLWVFMVLCSSAHAELKIDSIYPNIGKIGKGEELNVIINGSGFDENTRVGMSVFSDSKTAVYYEDRSPLQGYANDITIVDGKGYIAERSGLKVVNMSDFSTIGSVGTPGDAQSVTVVDGKAYLSCYNSSDESNTLEVIDVSNPVNPAIIGSVDTLFSGDVKVVDGKAYVKGESGKLQIIDVSNSASPTIMGSLCAWKKIYDVTAVDGKDYAYVSDDSGDFNVVDITNPANPQIIGSVDGVSFSEAAITVVDNKVYAASNYFFMVTDVSNPADPQYIGLMNPQHPQTIACESITVIDGKAYVLGILNNESYSYGLQVIDVSNPANPTIMGSVSMDMNSFPFNHKPNITVTDGIAYIAGGWSIFRVDVRDPTNPNSLDIVQHSVSIPIPTIIGSVGIGMWFSAQGVTVVGSTAYIVDGSSGLRVIDVSNPAKPQIISSIDTPGYAESVTVVDGKAYIADGSSGLQVINISNPANPQIIGSVDTPGSAYGVTIVGSTAYIADGEGLQVIDVSDSANPKIIGHLDTPGYAKGVTVVGSTAYIADGSFGLQVIDINDPQNPKIIGSVDTPGDAKDVTVVDGKAYLFEYSYGNDSRLQVIDVSNPAKPQIIGSVNTPGAQSVTVIDGKAYVGININYGGENHGSSIYLIDISNPAKPILVDSVDTPGSQGRRLTVVDGKAYVAGSNGFFNIVSVPVEAATTFINSNTLSVTLPSPEFAGQYNIRVFNNAEESEELKSAVSFFEPAKYWELAQKKAIIVAGRSAADDVLWNSTKTCTNMAYRALLTQGYTRNTIQYLNPENLDADHDGALNDVDDDADLSTLEYAISNWAADTNELLLYMTDHGGDGTFRINPTEIVTAQELDKQLDAFQNRTHARVILVYDACLSGSFIDYLQPPGSEERIIITSTKPNESSYFNGPEGQISFSYQFWSSVMLNGNLNAAFTAGDNIVTGHTPQLDGNGDGVTNQSSDYSEARAITICRGRSVKREPPRIAGISPDNTLSGEISAVIWVDNVTFTNAVDRIFAIIEPPGVDSLPADIPITDLPSVELAAVKDSNGNLTGKYEALYNNFNLKGIYKIAVYAVDKEEIYSKPARTNVIQTVGGTSLLVLATPKGGMYNKTQNVQLIASPADADIYYTVDGSNPDPSITQASNKYTESNPISISQDTTLKFIAIDSSGSKSPVYTENYTIDTIAPSPPDINLPENENAKIITNPYPTFYWKAPKDADYCTLQYSNSPNFSDYEEVSYLRGVSSGDVNGSSNQSSLLYTVSTPLSECGNWYWRIKSVDKAGNQSDWSSFEFSFEEDTAIHKAIIVSTGDIDPNTDANFKIAMETITSQAYTALTWQNYEKSNIYLLSSDNTFDADKDGNSDVSATLTKADFERAITNWASDADDLIIFMVGQGEKESLGEKGSFRLNSTETVTGIELDLWIDTLQSTSDVKVRIVYDATASGSFIPLLLPPQGKERITITSTPVIESKITPVTANFPDNGGLSFSYQFWFNIRNTAKLYDSYRIGHEMMTGHKQYATYDANGNGITYDDDDGEDGDFGIISKIKIGYGRIAASSPPVIGSVCSSQIVTQTQVSTKSFSIKNIWVSNIASLNPISQVLAVISKSYDSENGDSQPISTINGNAEIQLQDIDGDKKYEGSYSDQVTHNLFDSEGTYTIAIYAKDSQGYYSLPVTTTVTVVKDGDNSNYAILTEKSPAITIAEGVHVKVIGSAGANIVNVGSGAKVECINFPGQNQINIEENSSNFTIKRSGAMVYLQSTTTGTMVKIPATLTNQTIKFTNDNKSFTLVVKKNGDGDGAKVMFGSLEVGLSEIQV